MAVQSDGRNFIGETAKMMNGANDKSIISHVYLQYIIYLFDFYKVHN
jgi:hypothetical protein